MADNAGFDKDEHINDSSNDVKNVTKDQSAASELSLNSNLQFPKLSSGLQHIKLDYDVIVIGSGYGASVAACRSSRADLDVCVLERGKEWLPGDFPESFHDVSKQTQFTVHGKANKFGQPNDLYEVVIGEHISVIQGCGLGGGSLINANVGLDTKREVFENKEWPIEFLKDLDNYYGVDTSNAKNMLRPKPYPDSYPPLGKTKVMKMAAEKMTDIENLGDVFYKLPLYVNFESTKRNHVGVPQPACNNCGNCCSGCNTGAKNTLNSNYLADAKAHGAELYTEVEVTGIIRDPHSTSWLVYYRNIRPNEKFAKAEKFVRAEHVFVGAGSLGSSKLLIKSKQRGLDISNQVGKRFSGNGDFISASYKGNQRVNGIGLDTGKYETIPPESPGPTITAAIDLRNGTSDGNLNGVIIEDGTVPGSLEIPFAATLALLNKNASIRPGTKGLKLDKIFKTVGNSSLKNSIAFLGMAVDDGKGEITVEPKTGGVLINWDKVGHQKIFNKINSKMQTVVENLGGTFISNPVWSDLLDKSLVTVHPLGGCVMANSGHQGVVNHMGEVFMGNSAELHPGLYVIDGSIIPSSVGCNPSLTITSLAERNMRLIGEKLGWKIDYELDKGKGIRFTERMAGEVKIIDGNISSPCEFILTILSDDVQAMIDLDESHSAGLEGTVTCPHLSKEAMPIANGRFQLFKDNADKVEAKVMTYDMDVTGSEGVFYRFHGIKHIHKDSHHEIGLKDTTLLEVEIFKKINGDKEELCAKGELKIHLTDFSKQLASIEITNVNSNIKKLQLLTKFGGFFAKSLWETYGRVVPPSSFDPYAPPRLKRPLDLGDVAARQFKIITPDKIELRLTRFEGGRKGPILAAHGMGTSSILFKIDTIEMNFIEYFVKHGYDVWLLDNRVSTDLPWTSHLQHSLDDIAENDWETAVNKVLEVTKHKNLQAFVHCIGSLSFFIALLRGKMQGKIRSVVASQVALHPMACIGNRIKSQAHLSSNLNQMGLKEINVIPGNRGGCVKKAISCSSDVWADIFCEIKEQCNSTACHRITFMYNLLYCHDNLNSATHDCLHEIMGVGTAEQFKQVSSSMRKSKLVDAKGRDVYLPGIEDDSCENLKKFLNIPITVMIGGDNDVFEQEGPQKTISSLKLANPKQDYHRIVIKGYGHLDVLLGKSAYLDVFPLCLEQFDRYQSPTQIFDSVDVSQLKTTMEKVNNTIKDEIGTKSNTASQTINSLDPDSKIAPVEVDNNYDEVINKLLNDNDFADADITEVDGLQTHLGDLTPCEKVQRWKPGSKRNFCFFQSSKNYEPPKGTAGEPVFIEQSYINDYSSKREIYAMSDLHLGGLWSKDIITRMEEFLKTLAKIAEQCVHTIVLLGDIFEMWLTPITMTPPSAKEYIDRWKNDPAIQLFTKSIRKMAEEDEVRVFFVRGNHDHEITAQMIRALFGDCVKFIPGMLIYRLNNGDQEYRIRFEHGHDYDLFNTYSVLNDKCPLPGKPIGYFISRAAATSESYMTDTEQVLESVINAFLRFLPKSTLGATAMEILSIKKYQRQFLENLLERALREDIADEACILMDNGKWSYLTDVMDSQFIKFAIYEYGSARVFSMLRASVGIFDDFIKESDEDVIVLGHTHHWKNRKCQGRHGDVLYANTGAWTDTTEHFSYVKIVPPKKNDDGCVEVNYKLTNPCDEEDNET